MKKIRCIAISSSLIITSAAIGTGLITSTSGMSAQQTSKHVNIEVKQQQKSNIPFDVNEEKSNLKKIVFKENSLKEGWTGPLGQWWIVLLICTAGAIIPIAVLYLLYYYNVKRKGMKKQHKRK